MPKKPHRKSNVPVDTRTPEERLREEQIWRRRHFDEKVAAVIFHMEWTVCDMQNQVRDFEESMASGEWPDYHNAPAMELAKCLLSTAVQMLPNLSLNQVVDNAVELDRVTLELLANKPPATLDLDVDA